MLPERRRFTWFGHVTHKSLTKAILQGTLEGGRRRGRQRRYRADFITEWRSFPYSALDLFSPFSVLSFMYSYIKISLCDFSIHCLPWSVSRVERGWDSGGWRCLETAVCWVQGNPSGRIFSVRVVGLAWTIQLAVVFCLSLVRKQRLRVNQGMKSSLHFHNLSILHFES